MSFFDIGTLRAFLTLDNSQYKKGTDEAIQSTGKLNAGLVNLAAGLSLVRDGYAITRQAMGMYTDAANDAYSSVIQFQRMTGASTEQAGKWHDMLETLGMDISDMSYAFKAFSNNVDMAANDPNSGAAAAFKKLGVSVRDANGNLKDSNALMLETLSAFGKMQNGTEKNALAMDTLGRSYMSLGKLIDEGTDAQQTFGDTTTSITEKGRKDYKEYQKAVNGLNAAFKDMEVEVGTGLYPLLTNLANAVKNYILPVFDEIGNRLQYIGYIAAAEGYAVSKALHGDFSGVPDTQMSYGAFLQSKFLSNASFEPTAAAASGGGSIASSGSGAPTSPTDIRTMAWEAEKSRARGESISAAEMSSTGASRTGVSSGSRTNTALESPWSLGATQWNQYANGATNYGAINPATDTSGWTTGGPSSPSGMGGLSFEYMVRKLQGMTGVSDRVKAYLQTVNAKDAETARKRGEVSNIMNIIKNGTPEQQAKLQGAWNNMSLDDIARVANENNDLGGFSWGEQSQYSDLVSSEFKRLTTGDNAKYDANGNAIIYVTIEGKQVGSAIVSKLALLGVKK